MRTSPLNTNPGLEVRGRVMLGRAGESGESKEKPQVRDCSYIVESTSSTLHGQGKRASNSTAVMGISPKKRISGLICQNRKK